MFDLWSQELTEQETEALVSKAAEAIRKRRMETPAILFLEMHKPLSYLASQAAIVFSPFIVPFVGQDKLQEYSRLFSKRENVERLIKALEADRQAGNMEAA